VSEILHDVRFTFRSLRRRPAFVLTAVVTLALAIGINTGAFTLVNAILLKQPPVREPGHLVDIYTSREDRIGGVTSYGDFKDLQERTTSMTGIAAHTLLFANLTWQGRSETLIGEFAGSNYLDVLGIRPQLGRFFTAEEERAEGASFVAVIGNRLWKDRFGGSPAALGQQIQLNGKPYTIVGIMPADFEGLFPGFAPEVWAPLAMNDLLDSFGMIDTIPSPGKTKMERRGYRWLWLTGRLKDGVSVSQAKSELKSIMAQLAREYPQSNKDVTASTFAMTDVRINPDLDGALRGASGFLLIAGGLVLLVACTNVAGMFLARSSARRREIAVRLALGTGRRRLIQQLLMESTFLALTGGMLGLALATILVRVATSVQLPIPFVVRWNVAPDWRVFLFTFGISLIAGVSFGLFPAIQSTRRDLITALKGEDEARSGRQFFRNGLVVVQFALSMLLLVCGALFVRSMDASWHVNAGFAPDRIAMIQLNLQMYGYEGQRAETFYQDLKRRLAGVPGVEAVSGANRTPLTINVNTTALYPTATPPAEMKPMAFDSADVDPGFFETLRIPILEGRVIDERDGPNTPVVVVISQAAARQLWLGQSAVGKQMRSLSGEVIQVVGVSADYKVRTVDEPPRSMVHFARLQKPNPFNSILVRTSGRASNVLPALRSELQTLDPNVIPFALTTLEAEMSNSLFGLRSGAVVLAALGTFAVFLAGVGLYGLIAYSVSRRTREIGTRIALGATQTGIVRQVLQEGLRLVAVGAVLGIAAAAVVSRLMQSLLYGVGTLDWVAFSTGTLLLMAVAVIANVLPAVSASRVDPIRALKMD
jgi:predicted permease